MGRGVDLNQSENQRIVQELVPGMDTMDISKLPHRHHRTVYRFVNEGKFKIIIFISFSQYKG